MAKVRVMEHKSIKEKMSGMSKKEKASYIWEYFRYPIIGAIVGIAIIISIVNGIVTQKQSVLGITLMGKYVDSNILTEFENKTTKELIKDNPKNKKTVRYEFLTVTDNPMDQYTMASRDKITITVAAGEVDVMILDKKSYEDYVKVGMFKRLDTMPNFSSLNLKGYSTVKGALVDENVTKEEGIYGISTDNLPALKNIKFDSKDTVLCIVANSKRLDTVTQYINWLFSQS
jgi:uncharacterized membrane protein